MLTVGSKAPDFTLPDQNGEMHFLGDYVKAMGKVKAADNPQEMLEALS